MARLTATKVKSLKRPGRYGDGTGLYLVVRPSGSKAWVQRIVIDGKRKDIGLGGFPAIGLKDAREKALANRNNVATGGNPVAAKRKATLPTFDEMSMKYLATNAPRWKNTKTSQNFKQTLERYALPMLGGMRIDRIQRSHVLDVLDPIWTSKPSMARKLRQRLRAIFAYAMAHHGEIVYNPAGDVINAALPPVPSVKAHFRALPYEEVEEALKIVGDSRASIVARSCLRFLVLTAVRSGEARNATWNEIDLNAATWTIPGERMKAGREHRVPLSQQALEVLQLVRILDDNSGLVFPSPKRLGRPLSDMTLTKLLRDNGLSERSTVHGFRTSFKTWYMERTNVDWAVGESALAHSLGNSTEQAYARSDLFEKRRALMQAWADYLLG